MNQQIKVRVLTSVITLFLITALAVMVKYFLVDSFVEMEKQQTLQNIERASAGMESALFSLAKEASDWAQWDEAYAFIQSSNTDFIAKNLPAGTFSNLRITMVLFISSSGKTVYSAEVVPGKKRTRAVPEKVTELLVRKSFQLQPVGNGTGLVLLPEGPILFASRPIVDTLENKPARGFLIMGRRIDTAFLADLATITQLPVAIQALNAAEIAADFQKVLRKREIDRKPQVMATDNRRISGYTMLRDISGKPAVVMKVTADRNLYTQGLTAARYFILWFSLAALVAALIINILFDKLLLVRQKGEESEEKYRSVVNQATEGIVIIDANEKRILESNEAFLKLVGSQPGECSGRQITDLFADREASSLDHTILHLLKGKRDLKLRRSDGSQVDVEISASFIAHHGNDAVCFMVHDMTERKRFEERLVYEATHDTLTNLPNRNLLNDHLDRALEYVKRHQQSLALFLLDLDNFKIVNDTLGHSAGDLLLEEVSARLLQCVRKYDIVARLGGDEFVILMSGIRDSNHIISIADKVVSIFSQPFQIMDHEMFITVSVGIAVAPENGDKAEILLMNADTAMYHVKGSGKNGYEFFNEQMNVRISERLEQETRLRRALERNEFCLHYQPKIDLASGTIVGMEALIRWMPEKDRIVPPLDFIPLLEETGLIVPVGEWVIREACRQNREWHLAGLENLVVSTNMSARQFYQVNLPELIGQILRETSLEPKYLKIELTESIVMQDIDMAIGILNRLKEMGLSLSIDDFGTGYSSLAYLKRFPVDELKIDKSFVNGLGTDMNDSTIVNTIISMAHSMQLKVVAEGVETADQLELLRERSCEEVQGFYFSRPLAPGLFEEMMRSTTNIPH
jgi:diguanylate cyclase (GGDEF)-like protein/PAS domain S-box-containing protein